MEVINDIINDIINDVIDHSDHNEEIVEENVEENVEDNVGGIWRLGKTFPLFPLPLVYPPHMLSPSPLPSINSYQWILHW